MNRSVEQDLKRRVCGSINGVRSKRRTLIGHPVGVAMLQQMVEVKGMAISMTAELAETICGLAENDPRVLLIEAKYWGMPLADLKKLALTVNAVPERKDRRPGDVR